MKMLKDNTAVQKMRDLLTENGRKEQAAEYTALIAALDNMEQQFNVLSEKLWDVKHQRLSCTAGFSTGRCFSCDNDRGRQRRFITLPSFYASGTDCFTFRIVCIAFKADGRFCIGESAA